jgi:hypothetical protein
MVDEKNSDRAGKLRRGGRKLGTPNKKSPAVTKAIKFIVRKSLKQIPDNQLFEGDSYDFLVVIYKDMRQPFQTRMDAARAAINHERPRLQSSTVQHSGTLTLESLVTEAIKNPPSE